MNGVTFSRLSTTPRLLASAPFQRRLSSYPDHEAAGIMVDSVADI